MVLSSTFTHTYSSVTAGTYNWQITSSTGCGTNQTTAGSNIVLTPIAISPTGLNVIGGSNQPSSANITVEWSTTTGESYTLEVKKSTDTLYTTAYTGTNSTFTLNWGTSPLDTVTTYNWKITSTTGCGTDQTTVGTNFSILSDRILPVSSTWSNGTLTSGIQEEWFMAYLEPGKIYKLQWDDDYEGSGTTTVDVKVTLRSTSHTGSIMINEKDSGL